MKTLTTSPVAAAAKLGESPLMAPKFEEVKPQKRSSVRHTRAIQCDRTQRPLGAPPAEAVVARLTEIVHPATLAQVSYFHGLGLRARLLTLPVMMALVRNVTWLTRAKKNLKHEVVKVLAQTPMVQDRIVWIGEGATRQRVRLVGVQGPRHDPSLSDQCLGPGPVADRSGGGVVPPRWRVEDAFAIGQRLLGLAYFHGGAENAIEMQVWATWLLYAVLIDLTDAVAAALARPFADLSPAMVYRSLYFVTNAVAQDPTTDLVRYLADHARELGILKRPRRASSNSLQTSPIYPLTINQMA